jgi:hypothetical protein
MGLSVNLSSSSAGHAWLSTMISLNPKRSSMKRRDFAIAAILSPSPLAACGGGGDDSPPFPRPHPLRHPTPQATAAGRPEERRQLHGRSGFLPGGYVWSYSPDLTQTFGEMEAKRTMLWLQPPGTSSIGHIYLDAYHATGDERFYQAADRTAKAVAAAQHSSGGWNYIYDFAGEESLKHWYDTVGKNGWRLEEFQHYYGNATFDDATTAVASQLMLRMYLEKRDPVYQAATDKAIEFITDAQFGPQFGVADGGWPQRFPHNPNASQLDALAQPVAVAGGRARRHGRRRLHAARHLQRRRDGREHQVPDDVRDGPGPHRPGGQHHPRDGLHAADAMDLGRRSRCSRAGACSICRATPAAVRPGEPGGARSYEPRSLATHTTQTNIQQLLGYFTLTGDRKYLSQHCRRRSTG